MYNNINWYIIVNNNTKGWYSMDKNVRLIEPLLKRGNVYRLKCEKCKSVSVQISENKFPDNICFECGGKCKVF